MSYVHRGVSRRAFLRRSAAVTAFAGTPLAANLMAIGAASAQTAGDYKALVCVYLDGGNDQSNTIVPRTGTDYDNYRNARSALALAKESLLSLTPDAYSGPALGLHPSLPGLQKVFSSGRLGILANVGTLIEPINKTQWNGGIPTVRVPFQLFSHSDQKEVWQAAGAETSLPTGWMGRMGDLLESGYNPNSGVSMMMSVAGNAKILVGDQVIQYQLTTQGAVQVQSLNNLFGNTANGTTVRNMMTQLRTHSLESELTAVGKRAIDTEVLVRGALSGVTLRTVFPTTSIGSQLRMVAQMVAARGALSQQRQVFYVQQSGYDFHDNLLNDHNTRMKELNDALAAFDAAMTELGTQRNVTTFTASDFGRALQSNGRGADHGWGTHQFVMGGAVLGRKVYGKFPQVTLGGAEDGGQGRLLPTTATEQYSATLATWFGVSSGELSTVLPNIDRFGNANLGFLG